MKDAVEAEVWMDSTVFIGTGSTMSYMTQLRRHAQRPPPPPWPSSRSAVAAEIAAARSLRCNGALCQLTGHQARGPEERQAQRKERSEGLEERQAQRKERSEGSEERQERREERS